MINIEKLINGPSKLDESTLPNLKEMVQKYPFFQVARLLYLSNLYKVHSKDFGAELRKASVFVPDRTALFAMTEGCNYEISALDNSKSIETESDGNRTMSLINRFLTEEKSDSIEKNTDKRLEPSVYDLTNDYASFLEQQNTPEKENIEDTSTDTPKLKGADLIDNFIEETKGKQRFDIPDMEDSEFESPQFTIEDEEVYTESMVNIYIKQHRFQQALEILRKISLNNPKKSSNFAAQISLLEVILASESK